jgi:hypothetical protein
MRYAVQPKLLAATSAVALGLMVLIEVWAAILGWGPKQFDAEDRSFHFTLSAITTGTTHTVVSV